MQIPIEHIKAKEALGESDASHSWTDFMSKDIRIGGSGLKDKQKEEFYREMHLMLSTGMDIRMALEIFVNDITTSKHQDFFQGIENALIEGSSLSNALESTGAFSKYEYQNILIGEESGNLIEVLAQLALHFKTRSDQRRQLIGALSYPVLVLLTSVGAVGFMLQVVVPMFEDVFQRFGSELPWMTQLIITASETMNDHFLTMLLILTGISLFILLNRTKTWWRRVSSRVAMRIPFFGEIIRSAQLAKFSSAMYLLISSRHPLVQSISLVKDMVNFYPIEESLSQAEQSLISGSSLSDALSEEPMYGRKMVALIKMAEEVNKLDQVFAQLRDQFNEEVKYRSGLLSNVLEPLLIIFIGIMVGFILIAMYLPLFELSSGMGQ